jgi:hypothetical protein
MCIICHYNSDNQLVTIATRTAAHPDGFWKCLRPKGAYLYTCVDCGLATEDYNHVCETLPQARSRQPTYTKKELGSLF